MRDERRAPTNNTPAISATGNTTSPAIKEALTPKVGVPPPVLPLVIFVIPPVVIFVVLVVFVTLLKACSGLLFTIIVVSSSSSGMSVADAVARLSACTSAREAATWA